MRKMMRPVALVISVILALGLLGACNTNKGVASSAPGTTSTTSTAATDPTTGPTEPTETPTDPTEPDEPDETRTTSATSKGGNVPETSDPSVIKPTTPNPSTPEEAYGYIEEYDGPIYYTHLKTADTLYRINGDKLNDPERNMMLSLSGIVAQEKSEIFISYSHSKVWEQALIDYYGVKFVDVATPWDMVEIFRDRIKDSGYVAYETWVEGKNYALNPNGASSVNVATAIAGQERYIMIEDSLAEKAESVGLVKKMDARDWDEYEIYQKYKESYNKDVIISLAYFSATQRDWAIALKMMCWRGEDLAEFEEMLLDMNPGAICSGWHDDEIAGVMIVSACGMSQSANDHATNFPVYAGLPKSNFKQRPTAKYAKDGEKVHYVSMYFCDGDSPSYLSRDFVNNTERWGAPGRGKLPITWTINPSFTEVGPILTRHIYNTATINDYFMGYVSGVGYFYPSLEPKNVLPLLTERAATYMKTMDLNYLTIAGYDGNQPEVVRDFLPEYSKHDQIKGGVVLYVKNHYVADSYDYPGAIFWSNGKPFVNVRDSLGLTDGTEADKARDIAEVAHRLNSYVKDPSRIEGYTILYVMVWKYSYQDVEKLVSLLDDDVKLVLLDEFMDLLKKNIKDKTDKYKLDDYSRKNPPDYTNMKTLAMSDYFDFNEIEKMTPSTRMQYDFEDGMQGWKIWTGNKGLDKVSWTRRNGKGEILMSGSQMGQMDKDDPNCAIYNRIKLPDKESITLNLIGQLEAADIRVMIADQNNKVHIVHDWKKYNDVGDHTIDISKFKGQSATILVQFRDGSEMKSGSRLMLTDIAIS